MDQLSEHPPKRRRLSLLQESRQVKASDPLNGISSTGERNGDIDALDDTNISITSTSKLASQAVAPFLSKHVPQQYAPQGGRVNSTDAISEDSSTKYCYRHRPDLKCRRQANEPSMEQLQRVSMLHAQAVLRFHVLMSVQELQTLSQNDQQGISHVWTLFSAAPSKHRNLMLQGILTQCCFPQLSLLSNSVKDLVRIDFISALPPELGFNILCFLDTTSLCKAAQVSRRWRTLADDDVVWHRMCEQHIDRKCTKCGWGLPLLERKRLRASKRQIQLRATSRGINDWSPNITPVSEASPLESAQERSKHSNPETNGALINGDDLGRYQLPEASYFPTKVRPWKDVYKDRFKVGSNWKHGRYSTRIFKGHTNGVMCLQFDENILATGSYDSTIKIWDIETGKEIRTLHGHTSGVRSLQFDNSKLISGSLDTTLKVWDWHKGECVKTYNEHTGGVICLHFVSPMLASGSIDKTIRIWNYKTQSRSVLRGHTDWVNAVKIDIASRTIFSASDDLSVRLWDLDTNETMKIIRGHVGQVQQVIPLPLSFDFDSIELDPSESSDDNASNLSTTPQEELVASSSHHQDAFGPGFLQSNRVFPPHFMLTSALDSTIRLWDVSTGKCLRTFFGHVEGVWALAADTLRIVSGAEDGMVKVWDQRNGRCEKTFTGHAGPVTCIGLSDSRIITGSEDCEVRMLSFKPEGAESNAPSSEYGEEDNRSADMSLS